MRVLSPHGGGFREHARHRHVFRADPACPPIEPIRFDKYLQRTNAEDRVEISYPTLAAKAAAKAAEAMAEARAHALASVGPNHKERDIGDASAARPGSGLPRLGEVPSPAQDAVLRRVEVTYGVTLPGTVGRLVDLVG